MDSFRKAIQYRGTWHSWSKRDHACPVPRWTSSFVKSLDFSYMVSFFIIYSIAAYSKQQSLDGDHLKPSVRNQIGSS